MSECVRACVRACVGVRVRDNSPSFVRSLHHFDIYKNKLFYVI